MIASDFCSPAGPIPCTVEVEIIHSDKVGAYIYIDHKSQGTPFVKAFRYSIEEAVKLRDLLTLHLDEVLKLSA